MENAFVQQWILSTLALESIITQNHPQFPTANVHTMWNEDKTKFVNVVEFIGMSEYSVTGVNTKIIKYTNIPLNEALEKCADELGLLFATIPM